ncbi:hypothetical protein [Actinokineospora iranica]|uniref:CopC domain-containing protein n=1 Tax=Actinokineospora iranica TaxID=1271860 RepID=A0A1G6RX11_9PSEU|nr:hypothetical protein [Actinokineospora iranica]SDD09202.1 hypothetical protein SAMN05216174_10781 [Actinokineospora iranica]
MRVRLRRQATLLATVAGLLLAATPVAQAYEPVNIVHTEKVQAGPYPITVGFSTWPLRAIQSLDFTFAPDGGIEGKSGTLTMTPATRSTESRKRPLVRHPRKLEVWGLDIRALEEQGDWTFRFRLDGPEGPGEGALTLTALEPPGPPMALNWSLSTLPLIGLVAFLAIAWRRTRAEVLAG